MADGCLEDQGQAIVELPVRAGTVLPGYPISARELWYAAGITLRGAIIALTEIEKIVVKMLEKAATGEEIRAALMLLPDGPYVKEDLSVIPDD